MSRTGRTDDAVTRPRAAHLGPAARRPLVLDAALAVWSRHGHAGTTMAAIADAAGVSKPVLYECYPSKDAVLLALLDREEQRLLGAATAALPTAVSDLRADVEGAYTAFFHAVLEHPLSWRVVLDAQGSLTGPAGRRHRRGRHAVVEHVVALLDLAGAEPRPRHEQRVVAEHCVALAEQNAGRLLDPVPGEPTWTPASLAGLLAGFLLDGIVGSTAAGR